MKESPKMDNWTFNLYVSIYLFIFPSYSYYFIVIYDVATDPCSPSPCGSNALCKKRNGAGSCICMQNYFGDPYIGCRPECIQNSDCPSDKACFNTKCVNPCIGTCDINAECHVVNHSPICSCLPGYIGNALLSCQRAPPPSKISINQLSPSL